MLVVHAWDASFVGLVDTLAAHVREEETALWLDAFAVSQLEHQHDPAELLEVVKARSLHMCIPLGDADGACGEYVPSSGPDMCGGGAGDMNPAEDRADGVCGGSRGPGSAAPLVPIRGLDERGTAWL